MTVERFRDEVVDYLTAAVGDGRACPAYGAILTPGLYEHAAAWQRYCAEQGFAGLHWPTEFGGRGLTRAHSAVWYEECARAEVAPYLNLQGIVLAGEALLRAGTDEQKERLLPPTLTGDLVWCQLFSEPGAGSDLAGLQTRAVADGDRFVVNGQKVWSSNADVAHYGILLARTDPERPAHKGLSFFCYDMSLPGTEVRPLRQMTGDAEFCEVFLTDVAMPADALLGGLHEGWRVAMAVLEDERGSFGAAGAVSLNRRLDDLAPNLDPADPVTRDTFAGLLSRGRALGHLLSRCDGDARHAPVAKVMRSEMDFGATERELMANGAVAMLTGPDAAATAEVVDRFLYSPGMRIAGGSSEIQRNIIGERLLELPREPR
ncbi:MAG: acyl-CoA dehydrogenase family protein [Acidimicrobiia bacterium]|nr:acyl-CoA dehydrogenase family protein [Acidimicrobiia bacterium]